MSKPSRLATWPMLGGLYLLIALLSSIVNFYVVDWPFLDRLYEGSSGLIHPNLVINGALICVYVLLLVVLGKFRLCDFGFRGSLLQGVLYTVLLWVVIQLAVALWQLVAGNGMRLAPNLSQAWTPLVGALLGQLFGNVLLEEPLWRGFVWSQLTFKLRLQLRRSRFYAALLGSLLFALLHIPNQLVRYERSWADMPLWVLNIFILGLMFTFVYWLSNNLYIAMGFHALFNVQALIVWTSEAPNGDTLTDIIALVCGLLLAMLFRACVPEQINPVPRKNR